MKTHTFRGTKYIIEIESVTLDGHCEGTKNSKYPKLCIFTGLEGKRGMETCIHEALHACCFAKSEKIVKNTARDITSFLWRLGFRHGIDTKRA
jgi:hypothetical protein